MGARLARFTMMGAFALCCLLSSNAFSQKDSSRTADTTGATPQQYDPFGPENAPDHTGQGSGGVLTPSPYENIIQTYFTRVNADYYGVQYMLDSPLQLAIGMGWSAYQTNPYGFIVKVRTTGFKERIYDPVRHESVPYYLLSSEGGFEYPLHESGIRGFKLRTHVMTQAKGLSMPGVGVLVSKGNLLIAGDRPMGRKLELELTWIQVAGGYIMPLSPRPGGVNLAACGAVDLFGGKYQTYYAGPGEFVGAKIGSVGWLAAVGWNVHQIMNLSGYAGAEWGFATGALIMPTSKVVFSDIARTTLYFGLQATGRWFNITGGIQKQWEYIDFQSTEDADRALRYYAGASVYFRR